MVGGDRSIAGLQEIETKAKAQGLSKEEIAHAIKEDQESRSLQDQICQYATGILKTATLFLPRAAGIPWHLLAAGGVYAMDQMRWNQGDTQAQMLFDGITGFGKGVLCKFGMDKIGATSWRTWEKGAAIGGGGALLETGLAGQTWQDAQGSVNLASIRNGLVNAGERSLLGMATGSLDVWCRWSPVQ